MSDNRARRHVGLWTEYVRDFISKYSLEETQRQRAEVILLQCQNEADDYIRKEKDSMVAIDAAIEKAEAEKKPDDLKEAEARLNRLHEPIQRIFESKLKPRLDKLPTREQRKRAEHTAATSAPIAP